MAVDTKTVTGRRELHFASVDEMLQDVEQITSGDVKALGNWSPAQILQHLAISMNNTVDGVQFKAPWFVRLIAPFFKKSFLTKPMSPGFKMPKQMEPVFMPPEDVSLEQGLNAFREAAERLKAAKSFEPNSALGRLTPEEHKQFQLRHAEMHLSFIVPAK